MSWTPLQVNKHKQQIKHDPSYKKLVNLVLKTGIDVYVHELLFNTTIGHKLR